MTDLDPLGAPQPVSVPDLGTVLEDVFAVLEQRKRDMPEDSYTAKLLLGPLDKLLKKIAEESGEVIIAAAERNVTQLRYELGDLLYHMLVVMVRENISLDDMATEMADRRRK
ncbi:MAG: phosphoribosyl-ATP diphosphatase [Coriobacteriia bacterium]|nr:phosphoribosyl-ATP diphosphatase [Coriobacteriia bacterium]